MKKFSTLIMTLAILAGCQGPSKKELQSQNETLVQATAEKDKQMNDLISAIIEIDENIEKIKEKEKIIALDAVNAESNKSIEDKINEDIKLIYDLMLENKEKVEELQKKLKNSQIAGNKLNKLVKRLNEQLKQQSLEIMQLNNQLKDKNFEIADLNFTIEGLTVAYDSLQQNNEQTQEALDQTTTELYTAFYVFGTKKELKEQNILSTEGLPLVGKKEVMSKDFNTDYFTKVDTRETEEIPLFRKKAKVLSNHPNNSYEIILTEEETSTIKILDKNAFWSVSKYLVVQVN